MWIVLVCNMLGPVFCLKRKKKLVKLFHVLEVLSMKPHLILSQEHLMSFSASKLDQMQEKIIVKEDLTTATKELQWCNKNVSKLL